jgi:hypothetical protein
MRQLSNNKLYITVILMNRLVGSIIRALKEDPLSTGMLDVFFQKSKNHYCVKESTPTKQIIAAPLWGDQDLYLSIHIILISLIYFQFDRLIDPINWCCCCCYCCYYCYYCCYYCCIKYKYHVKVRVVFNSKLIPLWLH